MACLEEKSADKTVEKHVPLIEKVDGGYRVTVGSTLHPMEEKHFIEWIELIADGSTYRSFLEPGGKPSVFFAVEAEVVSAREYCNLHGLWKG
jgi:superoxide reductase